ncbi:Acetoacetate decarboxylase beta barrel domain [Lasallia pustulata]|uniref:Acetoacetate decarboxylase beta barrel domain n=1 Tax=Lasallia pustulata TaxID=136370 RepID=A0A1W5CYH4_9LECA|nr:Acetoacetate decarboxylase beta barrel domain [Lasallia pustulata]
MPGPRQTSTGQTHSLTFPSSSSTTATIKFKTSATLLRTLFPNTSYRFHKTDTVALASLSVQTLSNLDWLAGGSYDLLALYVHGVEYTTSTGEKLSGSYCPVMFENLTDPILSGREELGFPKLFSDIHVTTTASDGDGSERGSSGGGKCEARISWRGAEWATFSWSGLKDQSSPMQADGTTTVTDPKGGAKEEEEEEEEEQQGLFVHKCIPSSSLTPHHQEPHLRALDAEYDVFVPSYKLDGGVKKTRTQKAEHAAFEIKGGLGWEKLPTLQHIVGWMADMPVFEVVETRIVQADGVGDLSGARRVE